MVAVSRAAAKAIEWARSGKGPAFIEARTYRIQGHLESEDLFLAGGKYREKQEIEEWRKLDPISRFGQFLLSKGVCTTSQLDYISTKIAGAVDDAVRFAQWICNHVGRVVWCVSLSDEIATQSKEEEGLWIDDKCWRCWV